MDSKPSNVRWRVFALIAFASFVAYVLRTTMSIGAPAIIEDLGISGIQFGWITCAGLLWWYTRDFPQEHRAVNMAEVDLIGAKRPPPVMSPINPPGWVRILKNRDIVLLTISYAFSNYVFYSVMSYFFLYLVVGRQFGDLAAGGLNGQIWLVAAVSAAFSLLALALLMFVRTDKPIDLD